jgi:hypothetical protein
MVSLPKMSTVPSYMTEDFSINKYKPADLDFEAVMTLDLCEDIHARTAFLAQLGNHWLNLPEARQIYARTKDTDKNIPFGMQTVRQFARYFSDQSECWSYALDRFATQCRIFNGQYENYLKGPGAASIETTRLSAPRIMGGRHPRAASKRAASKRANSKPTTREIEKKARASGQYDKYMATHALTAKSRAAYAKRYNDKLSGDSL